MNLKQIAQKLGGYIQSKTQDDEGWVRQNKFTPVKQIQQGVQNWQQKPSNQLFNQAVSKVKPIAVKALNEFNRQQESLYGDTSGSYGNQLKTSLPGRIINTGINNYKQNIKLISDPNTQEQFTSNVGPLRQAAVNYTLAPLAQVPYNIKQAFNKQNTGFQRGVSGVQAALGAAQVIPGFTGLDDLIMAGVGGIKGIAQEKKQGKSTLEAVKLSVPYFTGQKYAGLGDLAFDDPTKQTIGNLAELPLTILAFGSIRNTKDIPLANQKQIDNAKGQLRKLLNSQEGMGISEPKQVDNIVNMLYKQDWRKVDNPVTQTAIKIARYIKASENGVTMSSSPTLGLTTKNISNAVNEGVEKAKLLDQPIKTGGDVKFIDDGIGLPPRPSDIPLRDWKIIQNPAGFDPENYQQGLKELRELGNKAGKKGLVSQFLEFTANKSAIEKQDLLDKALAEFRNKGGSMAVEYGYKVPNESSQISPEVKTTNTQPIKTGGDISKTGLFKLKNPETINESERIRQVLLGNESESILNNNEMNSYLRAKNNPELSRKLYDVEIPNKSSPLSPESVSKTQTFKKLGFETKGDNVVIHRGTGPSSPLEGNYFTGDKEYAREFLGSGRPEELKTVTVPIKDIYKPNVLPESVNEQQMTSAILEAKQKGFKALLVDEGGASTPSVFYIDKVKPDFYNLKNLSPESKGTIKLKDNDLVKTFDKTIKTTETPKVKVRGFTESVQETPKITKGTKVKVAGEYTTKPNDVLMGEAKALLNEGVDLKNINRIENIDQKIAATIQEAINLDAAGKHNEAAALFNNLSELGTQVGRGTQAFSLLNKMSPEAISLSVAGKIKKYNLSHNKKLPELTGEQQKQLSKQVNEALKFAPGTKERGVAIGRVNETINSFIPSTFADKFITVWKAGLLSSLRTHERNIVGNTLMQASEQASLYPAAGADYLMSLATGKRSLVASQKGSLKGAIEGGQTAADVLKYGFDPSGTEIGKYETKKVTWGNNPLEQSLKKATDIVFNTLEAEDKVFWKSSYNRSLYNQAITQAVNEGKKGNSKYIQKLFDNATEEMKQTAFNDANYATFKDKNMLSGAIGQYKSWVNRQTGPAAEAGKIVSEMLMPFTGVPTSIVGKTVAYSPIGLVKGSVDFGRVVAGSEVPGLQRQAAQEIGRGVIGSGIFGLGAYLMSQGLMTGQAKDQKERDQWALEGKQENSIFVNGKWRSINSVGPQTLVLLAGSKANETANDPEQNLGSYAFSTLNDQLNQTFLSGVQQPLAAINDPQGNKAKSYLGGQVSSLIPNIVKDTSKAFDPLKREVDTSTIGSSILGRVQQSIPFARNKMIPQRDVLGNEIAQTPTGIGAYFDLFNSTTPISNNVVNELSRLNQAGYSYTPSKLDKDQTIGKEKMTLNQAQLDRLETVTGLATDKALNDLFNTTAYQSMSDDEKQNIVKKTVDNTRKNVRANINLKNIQEKSYVKSSDSQLGGFSMFTKAVTTNPKAAMNALLTGNPIRKTTDGNIVVLERQNDVGSYDLGDTTSQVDHAIPLSLGGTNEVRNLQILTNEEHAIKTKTDMYLLNQVKSGQMELKDAQEKAKNWRDTALSLPSNVQSQMIDEVDSESADKQSDGSQIYKLVSDTGNVTLVDLGTPIKQPEYTGFDAIDKKLKSSYKSAITKRINNIVKLYEDGQLSAKEANKLIGELNTQYSSGTGTKNKSKKKITFKVTSPKALPKITLKISSPVSRVKLKSAPKIKLSKTDNRKYTIKA